MANNIVFSRIDSRLIHGQVAAKWTTKFQITRILVIDEASAHDPFLNNMLCSVAPAGTKVIVADPKTAADMFKDEKLNDGRYMLLFKDVKNVQEAYAEGLKLKELNVGNLPLGVGTKTVLRSISMTEKDAERLKHCAEGGMNIYFQIYPEDKNASLEQILKKFFPQV